MFDFIKKLFDNNERQLKAVQPVVDEINGLESKVSKMSIGQMHKRIDDIREKLLPLVEKVPKSAKSSIKVRDFKKGLPGYEADIIAKLNEFMPEVFAIIREITRKKFDRRHFDVQILTGAILAQGHKLVEVKTGEGKTQIFHLASALYALTGRGAHVITVNDYLAKRDGEYAGHILSEIGLSVGIVVPRKSYKFVPDEELERVRGKEIYEERMKVDIVNPGDVGGWNLVSCSKKEAYACDVVYGINNEFGFDYLRDNMVFSLDRIVQRELYYCIVDEVDSILIDEARTPLIISAPADKSNELYVRFAGIIPRLEAGKDYTIDEKAHSAVLTDQGIERVEKILAVKNLWEDYRLAHHLENALKAYTLYKRDDEYIVKDSKVLIVDQFTGRVLPGRRYSEGLHQAIEAKEGVEIKRESKTLATVTFQNFFRLYKVLGGGSGTVMTEAEEFYKIYNLDSIAIPPNQPVIRQDLTDLVYKNAEAKFQAVALDIKEKYEKGQPVLVGTTSIENSEYISNLIDKVGIEHEVLNAKHHEREAHIIEKAGQEKSVTIATNMAGRGTDIRLGQGVRKLGGLHVVGTERHEARRVDNQLRGRSGRQGDKGSSRFYVALDDKIMRMQGGEIIQSLMERTNIPDDMPIESKLVDNAIERSQKRMEGHHFDIRNNVVKYDDVMNQQREIFYTRRRRLLRRAELASHTITADISDTERDRVEQAVKRLDKQIMDGFSSEINDMISVHLVKDGKVSTKKLVDDFLDFADDQIIAASLVITMGKGSKAKTISKRVEETGAREYLIETLKGKDGQEVKRILVRIVNQIRLFKVRELGKGEFLRMAVFVMLQGMDQLWTDHLNAMGDLREGIGLRGVAQRDPLVEYKNEAFVHFDNLIRSARSHFVRRVFKVQRVERQGSPLRVQTNVDQIQDILTGDREMVEAVKKYLRKGNGSKASAPNKKVKKNKTVIKGEHIGRNDPCPCGSGKKYKKCCGRNL